MLNTSQYLKVHQDVNHGIDDTTLQSLVCLIESAITLMVDKPLTEVINNINVSVNEEKDGINILLVVDKRYRPIVFGKKFSNISCLRKLVANASGKTKKTFILNVESGY